VILTTKTKIALAGLAYRAIAMARTLGGKGDSVIVERAGLRWSLDLREGIDFSIYLLGAFERSTVVTLQKLARPGSVIFDIGANVGAHTLGLARSAGTQGRVYAFEPAALAFAKLQRNLTLNPELQSRTQARQLLFAADLAECMPPQIYASWPLVTEEVVHPKLRGRLLDTSGARVDTLDSFVEREAIGQLDLMKIDVDGHEYPVLKGGAKTLARFRPILLMEMSPYVQDEQKHGFPALVALLREIGYSLQEAGRGEPLPLDVESLQTLIPDGAGINVIARPGNVSRQ
jgi:FkbM family methyltransferase